MKTVLLMMALMASVSWSSINKKDNNPWLAPPEADKLVNPLKGNPAATAEGKRTFNAMCAMCHGETGKGDGMAGLNLRPRPANYTLEKTQKQSDGVLFWKMTEGRPPMASYKTLLTGTQRWQLVNYLRTFKKQ